MKRIASSGLIVGMVLALIQCGEENLQKLKPVEPSLATNYRLTSANISFCTTEPEEESVVRNFLFVIDKSRSNVSIPTDPDGSRRYQAILNYIAQAPNSPNDQYGSIHFSTAATIGTNGFVDKAAFEQHILAQRQIPDDGFTDYIEAISKIKQMITDEIAIAKQEPNPRKRVFYVIFESDGFPVRAPGIIIQPSEVFLAVDGLMAFLRDEQNAPYILGFYGHTAYYYNQNLDLGAQDLLAQMAKKMGGKALVFSGTSSVDIKLFDFPFPFIRYATLSLFVNNPYLVWWDNERKLSSDKDPLPDSYEIELGLNPFLEDQDNNGVGEYTELQTFGAVNLFLPRQFSNCVQFQDPSGKMKDTDKDGKNDCEEVVGLGTFIEKVDSNGDSISDSFAFERKIAVLPRMDESALDPDGDGRSNVLELKEDTPPAYPDDKILGLKPIVLKRVSFKREQKKDCYTWLAENIPVNDESDLNAVRVERLERLAASKDTIVIKKAEKPFDGRSPNLVIEIKEEDFK